MKIYINGRFLSRRMTGVDRFAYEIISAIDHLLDLKEYVETGEFCFEILIPPNVEQSKQFRNISMRTVGQFGGQLWEQFTLPIESKNGLLINLCNSAPVFSQKQLVVIHDVATARVPESYGAMFRAWYSVLMPMIYRRSASICTVSNFSTNELIELYGVRNNICVLPEGIDHIERVSADITILEKKQLNKPYVLAVSSVSPHKNFGIIIEAIEQMRDIDFDVVIAGGQNPSVFSNTPDALPESVKYVGYVSDEDLKALYENAICFIFPSYYEGYGLPPTEAMACGCPVLAANAASIPETCGDAALYFDPHNAEKLSELLKTVVNDTTLQNLLRKRGLEHANAMRWNHAAIALLTEIRRVSV